MSEHTAAAGRQNQLTMQAPDENRFLYPRIFFNPGYVFLNEVTQ
jgi:hypothetical protein